MPQADQVSVMVSKAHQQTILLVLMLPLFVRVMTAKSPLASKSRYKMGEGQLFLLLDLLPDSRSQ